MGLRQLTQAEKLRISARDVLGLDGTEETGRSLSDLADSVIAAAVEHIGPPLPMAVIGMGRLGGQEVGYDSDVDLLIVWDADEGEDVIAEAEGAAMGLARLIGGSSPATGAYRVDLNLRPEGRHGAPARSIQSYAAYYERWALPWERQALLRSRFVAGDEQVGDRFAELVRRFVWEAPLTDADILDIRRTKARIERERVPAGEDPKFHLKLGPGSLSDVEWTVQLLQLRHKVPAAGTMTALSELVTLGAVDRDDADILGEAYRFCLQTRNRLNLTRDVPGDSLPVTGRALSTLARSLGFTASGLRNEYTRVTRRARRVMERLFYEA
jgi:glutamate-ammonia-ligase adenylyltransferase